MHVKADFEKLMVIQAVAAVENIGRFDHAGVNLVVIQFLVLGPVGRDRQGVCADGSLVGIRLITDFIAQIRQILLRIAQRLGIRHHHRRTFIRQEPANPDRRAFAGVAGVRLEGKAEDGDALAATVLNIVEIILRTNRSS